MLDGFTEVVHPFQVRGWACDRHQLSQHCSIEITLGDEVIGRGLANVKRTDLAAAGIGDGDHGFVIDVAARLSQEDQAKVRVNAYLGDKLRELPRLRSSVSQDASGALGRVSRRYSPVDSAQEPIFVLGPARSGTTAVCLALIESGRYEGNGEGHVFPLLRRLIESVFRYYEDAGGEADPQRGTALGRIDLDYFFAEVREIFRFLPTTLYPTGRWVDKTPSVEMIQLAPMLAEIFPAAKFIFMRRRGIDNILSRQRKFPEIDFRSYCEDWTACMTAWMSVRTSIEGRWIELDQQDLARAPMLSARAIIDFLHLTPPYSDKLSIALEYNRPERTGDMFHSAVSIEETSWTDEEKRAFELICGDVMKLYGYSSSL